MVIYRAAAKLECKSIAFLFGFFSPSFLQLCMVHPQVPYANTANSYHRKAVCLCAFCLKSFKVLEFSFVAFILWAELLLYRSIVSINDFQRHYSASTGCCFFSSSRLYFVIDVVAVFYHRSCHVLAIPISIEKTQISYLIKPKV